MLLKFKFVQLNYHLNERELDDNLNILEVKKIIGEQLNIEYTHIKIVYMGKILTEEQIIKDTIQENNNAIHIVISNQNKQQNEKNEYTLEQQNKIDMLLNLGIINDKKQIINLLKDNQWNIDIVSNLLFEYM